MSNVKLCLTIGNIEIPVIQKISEKDKQKLIKYAPETSIKNINTTKPCCYQCNCFLCADHNYGWISFEYIGMTDEDEVNDEIMKGLLIRCKHL